MTAALTFEMECSVRYRMPGDSTDQIEAVGGPQDAADRIGELWIQHGADGEYVRRYVSTWEPGERLTIDTFQYHALTPETAAGAATPTAETTPTT